MTEGKEYNLILTNENDGVSYGNIDFYTYLFNRLVKFKEDENYCFNIEEGVDNLKNSMLKISSDSKFIIYSVNVNFYIRDKSNNYYKITKEDNVTFYIKGEFFDLYGFYPLENDFYLSDCFSFNFEYTIVLYLYNEFSYLESNGRVHFYYLIVNDIDQFCDHVNEFSKSLDCYEFYHLEISTNNESIVDFSQKDFFKHVIVHESLNVHDNSRVKFNDLKIEGDITVEEGSEVICRSIEL